MISHEEENYLRKVWFEKDVNETKGRTVWITLRFEENLLDYTDEELHDFIHNNFNTKEYKGMNFYIDDVYFDNTENKEYYYVDIRFKNKDG